MAVGAASSVGSGTTNGWGSGAAQELQDQFMQILLTQLRYQDPMEPLKEQEFLSQMAQFSSATQISDLNKTVGATLDWLVASGTNQSLLSAAGLIGKTMKAVVDEEAIEGVVDSVCYDSGVIMVKSGEYVVPIDSLVFIGEAPEAQQETPEAVQVEGQVESNAG